jgi:DNA-binding MarR family transcriptional regulator
VANAPHADHEPPSTDPPVDPLNRELVEMSGRFAKAFSRWLEGAPDSALSTYPRLRVLETLHCQGPARMVDLSDALRLPARNMTSVADALEADHLVRRTPHPTDRRATILEITEEGKAVAMTALAPRLCEIAALFDELSPTRKSQLLSTLSTLVASLEHDRPT